MSQFVRDTILGRATQNLNAVVGEVGATWTQQSPFTGNALFTLNSALRAENATSAFYRASGTPGSADYRAFVTLKKFTALSGQFFGGGVRMSTSADTVYFWRYSEDSGNLEYFKRVAGASTQIDGGAVAVTMADGAAIMHEIIGSSPATIRVLVNNVVKLTITDSDISAAGKMGIFLFGSMTESAGTHFQNIIGDDNTAASAITLISPAPYRVFQRSGTTADIAISGYYVGSPTSIEASFNGGAYQTIVASPANGKFSGTLTGQAQGSGTLTVRFTNDTSISTTAAHVGIGDIFVIAGQSNGSGRATNNQTYTGTANYFIEYDNAYQWRVATDPVDVETNQIDSVSDETTAGGLAAGSVWPLVANSLVSAYSVPVAFIPCAMGATVISSWQPGGTGHTDRTTLYGSMIYRAQKLGAVKGVLWWQGESDALAGSTQAAYHASLSSLIAAIQTDLSVPVFTAKLQFCTGADVTNVNAAIVAGWSDITGDVTGPDLLDQTSDDGFHLQGDVKVATAATRWANAILAQFPAADTTPPTVSGEVTAPTTLTLTFSESVTGVVAADFALATGHTLSAASGSGTTWTMTISPAVIQGETVTLTYTPAEGVIDGASPPNEMAGFSNAAVTNSSTLTVPDAPTLTSDNIETTESGTQVAPQAPASDGGSSVIAYEIWRKRNSGVHTETTFRLVKTLAAADLASHWLDTSTVVGDTVDYKVRCYNAVGYSSYSATQEVTSQGPLLTEPVATSTRLSIGIGVGL